MSLQKYLFYQGNYYDIGTKVKMKTKYDGIIITTFNGYGTYEGQNKYSFCSAMPPEYYIVEIVEPIEVLTDTDSKNKGKSNPRQGDIQIGWMWYIVVMLVGSIFNDRWMIWIAATVIFFIWKGGNHLGKKGGKK